MLRAIYWLLGSRLFFFAGLLSGGLLIYLSGLVEEGVAVLIGTFVISLWCRAGYRREQAKTDVKRFRGKQKNKKGRLADRMAEIDQLITKRDAAMTPTEVKLAAPRLRNRSFDRLKRMVRRLPEPMQDLLRGN